MGEAVQQQFWLAMEDQEFEPSSFRTIPDPPSQASQEHEWYIILNSEIVSK